MGHMFSGAFGLSASGQFYFHSQRIFSLACFGEQWGHTGQVQIEGK